MGTCVISPPTGGVRLSKHSFLKLLSHYAISETSERVLIDLGVARIFLPPEFEAEVSTSSSEFGGFLSPVFPSFTETISETWTQYRVGDVIFEFLSAKLKAVKVKNVIIFPPEQSKYVIEMELGSVKHTLQFVSSEQEALKLAEWHFRNWKDSTENKWYPELKQKGKIEYRWRVCGAETLKEEKGEIRYS
jgi:hypothetical protein